MNSHRSNCPGLKRTVGAIALTASLWGLSGCTTPPADQKQASAPTPPVQPVPFDEAMLKAANDLFGRAQLPDAGAKEAARYALVIDPLIDGVSARGRRPR